MKKLLFFLGIFLLGLSACKKDKEIVIGDNTAPPDGTISNIVKENYVNKAYISVLGRKPSSTELQSGITILDQNNLSMANRGQMLDEIFNKPGYHQRLYDLSIATLLNNLDTAQITTLIFTFDLLLMDPMYAPQYPQIQAEKTKLELLQASVAGLNAGTIDVIGLQKRCINNYFYDQINMGTENFVVSSFQNFLYRYPTATELTEASAMVNGFEGILFLLSGKTKDDYLTIFFGCNNYFEGQVRDLFLKYLFREPTSVESSEKSLTYKNSLNYKALQKDILSLDEYVGI